MSQWRLELEARLSIPQLRALVRRSAAFLSGRIGDKGMPPPSATLLSLPMSVPPHPTPELSLCEEKAQVKSQ